MGKRHTHHDFSSLAWMEEFGNDATAVHACSCSDCLGVSPDVEASIAGMIATISAVGR